MWACSQFQGLSAKEGTKGRETPSLWRREHVSELRGRQESTLQLRVTLGPFPASRSLSL